MRWKRLTKTHETTDKSRTEKHLALRANQKICFNWIVNLTVIEFSHIDWVIVLVCVLSRARSGKVWIISSSFLLRLLAPALVLFSLSPHLFLFRSISISNSHSFAYSSHLYFHFDYFVDFLWLFNIMANVQCDQHTTNAMHRTKIKKKQQQQKSKQKPFTRKIKSKNRELIAQHKRQRICKFVDCHT